MIRLAQRLRKLKKTPFENRSSWVHCPSRRSCWHLHALLRHGAHQGDATAEVGLNWLGLILWGIVGLLTIQMWFHGCVARKRHEVLYKRMFL
jgi:hypothetical protein